MFSYFYNFYREFTFEKRGFIFLLLDERYKIFASLFLTYAIKFLAPRCFHNRCTSQSVLQEFATICYTFLPFVFSKNAKQKCYCYFVRKFGTKFHAVTQIL